MIDGDNRDNADDTTHRRRYNRSNFHLTEKDYGCIMAAFVSGAAIAAFASGNFDRSEDRIVSFDYRRRIGLCIYCFGN